MCTSPRNPLLLTGSIKLPKTGCGQVILSSNLEPERDEIVCHCIERLSFATPSVELWTISIKSDRCVGLFDLLVMTLSRRESRWARGYRHLWYTTDLFRRVVAVAAHVGETRLCCIGVHSDHQGTTRTTKHVSNGDSADTLTVIITEGA